MLFHLTYLYAMFFLLWLFYELASCPIIESEEILSNKQKEASKLHPHFE